MKTLQTQPVFRTSLLMAAAALLAACAGSPVAPVNKNAAGTPATTAIEPKAQPAVPEPAKAARQPGAIEGRPWFLINLPIALSAGGPHSREGYIRFNHLSEKLEGHTGCNPLKADYVLEGQKVRISNVTAGKMPCTDAVTFEALLIQSLSDAVIWEQLDDGRLVLKNDEGFPLAVFRPGDRDR